MPGEKPSKPKPTDPDELGPGGRALWDSVLEVEPEMTEYRRVDLHEACRITDRLNAIDKGLGVGRDESVLTEIAREDGTVVEVVVKGALTTASNLADKRLKLIATLRLPAPDGKTQPYHGGSKPGVARGSYSKGSNVSAIDRARSRGA